MLIYRYADCYAQAKYENKGHLSAVTMSWLKGSAISLTVICVPSTFI